MIPNITAPFQPLKWQIPAWRDKSPVLLLTGSAGGGKSNIAAEKVHGFLKKYAGATGVGLRKAREYASKSIVPMMQFVIGDDKSVEYADNCFRYSNGSRLYIGGMKDKSQREAVRSLRGKYGEPDILWMEEANAFTRADYDEASARVRGKVADWTQVILTTNPDSPYHWIYTDLILGSEAVVYYSSARDNPNLPASYFGRLDRLVGVLRDRLRDGKWVQAEGVVYDEYDPAIHLIDPFPIPSDWRKIRVVDFGFTNPFVNQWWAIDPDLNMYMYREIYHTQRLVEDLTKQIMELSKGERIEATIADHDAEDRATMLKHGIATIPATKDISPGIQAVKIRLGDPKKNIKPRIFFFRGATIDQDDALLEARLPASTDAEITVYSYPKSSEGKPVKEVPLDMYNHGMDCTRYGVIYVDGKPASLPTNQPKNQSKFAREPISNDGSRFKKY